MTPSLIQAKRYGPNTTVGSPEIQQYASLRNQFDGVDKVLLVTTNDYSRQARETAEALNIKLINGDELVELIHEHESLDLVAKYLDFIQPVEESESESGSSDTSQSPLESEAEPTSAATETQPSTPIGMPSTRWRNVIAVASVGWAVTFFSILVLPEWLWWVTFGVTWLGLPTAIYFDTRAVADHTEWPRFGWLYIVRSLVWFVGWIPGLFYLWRRHLALANE